MKNKKKCSTCSTSMILWLFRGTPQQKIITAIRIVFGLWLALMFGLGKIAWWVETRITYWSVMQYIGIWFGFAFRGLLAGLAEFVWWIAFALGYKTRIAWIFIIFVMIAAIIGHISATEWMLAEMWPWMAIITAIVTLLFVIFPNKWNSVCDNCK